MDNLEDINWSSDDEWINRTKDEITQTQKRNKKALIASAVKVKRKYGILQKKRKVSKPKQMKILDKGDEFSSSDEIPLKVLAESLHNTKLKNRKGKKHYTNSDSDDLESCIDSEDSYKPCKKDINSSDSEFSPIQSETEEITVQKNEKENKKLVAALSLKEAAHTFKVTEENLTRLDTILQTNGMQRQPVKGDGNCCFQAAAIHLTINAYQLRQQLCDFMMDNVNQFRDFFVSHATENFSYEEDLFYIDYSTEVSKLREDGYWSSNSGDFFPYVLAEWSGRNVRIFQSSPIQPILDLHPVSTSISFKPPIFLAFISSVEIPQHYDGCVLGTESILDISQCEKSSSNYSEKQMHETNQTNNTIEKQKSPEIIPENSEILVFEQEKSLQMTPKKVGRPTVSVKPMTGNALTPVKKKLVRKRKATPENWKKNIRKRRRALGQAYISQRGKEVEERQIKEVSCSKCKHRCSEKISENQRMEIFKAFWSLASYERKKDFVISKVHQKQTRTYLDNEGQPVKKTKNFYRVYSFNVDDSTVTVCKTFFLKTLSIGEAFVSHALQNQSGGTFIGGDKRGKHQPHNKTKERAMALVRKHIESFPAVEGHYCRKDTQRKFLGSDLNITKMYGLYLELYKDKAREDELVSQAIYRKTFNEEYNFSFHLPKKDQCNVCVAYHREKASGNLTDEMIENFCQHQQNKTRAREEKEKDKENAKELRDKFVCTFDLQAVLSTPCSLVNQMYYNRKLSCYNLSIFNLANKSATCYLWPEVEAKRGSCEIATCLYLHLLSLPSNIKHAVLYSDNCSGQNRNQFIATSLMHAVTFLPNIEVIDHKFLEQGHTQMECDSMHSAIEFAKKKTEVFIPNEWATVIRMARRKNPYLVVPLKHGDIWDFKKVQAQCMKYSKFDTNGLKINWMKLRWLRFQKADTDMIQFKYQFDEEFKKMKVSATGKRGRPGERTKDLPRLYSKRQAISAAKKKDLISLCSSNVIPNEYHEYYKNLPTSSYSRDKLPDPDIEEIEEESDLE